MLTYELVDQLFVSFLPVFPPFDTGLIPYRHPAHFSSKKPNVVINHLYTKLVGFLMLSSFRLVNNGVNNDSFLLYVERIFKHAALHCSRFIVCFWRARLSLTARDGQSKPTGIGGRRRVVWSPSIFLQCSVSGCQKVSNQSHHSLPTK